MSDGVEGTAVLTRTRGRPKLSQRADIAVKLDRALAGKAKLVATHRGVSVAELLSDLARGPVDKAYATMLRELEGRG